MKEKQNTASEVILSVDELKQMLNQKVAVTDYYEITQQHITEFARVTQDYQWIHTDIDRASKESPYKTTVAHGFLILSFLPVLFSETIKIKNVKFGVNYGLNFVRFISPVLSGAKIRAHIKPKNIIDFPDGFHVVWSVMIETPGTVRPACITEWIVRYYFADTEP
jgi:acyl dehydratase